jgi:hypothetical protein
LSKEQRCRIDKETENKCRDKDNDKKKKICPKDQLTKRNDL